MASFNTVRIMFTIAPDNPSPVFRFPFLHLDANKSFITFEFNRLTSQPPMLEIRCFSAMSLYLIQVRCLHNTDTRFSNHSMSKSSSRNVLPCALFVIIRIPPPFFLHYPIGVQCGTNRIITSSHDFALVRTKTNGAEVPCRWEVSICRVLNEYRFNEH